MFIGTLQVYYLDNKFFGEHAVSSRELPRMKHFNGDKMASLIMLDTVGLVGCPLTRKFGAAVVSYYLRPIILVIIEILKQISKNVK